MSGFLDRCFRLEERGTTARTEVVAGLTTFATLSYILFLQPALLSNPACGMDAGGVLFATCLASATACFLMAWWGNHPVALAPGMGMNVFFVFTVCGGMGFTWQEALAANLVAGLLFLALTPFGFRERVMAAIPDPLKHAVAAGIGLMIALVGFEWAGIVVDDPVLHVGLGDLSEPVVLLSLFGLAIMALLSARKIPGAILIGMLVTALAGWGASRLVPELPAFVRFEGLASAPPSPRGTAFELDFGGLLARPLSDGLTVVAVLFLVDLFDTVGTLFGVGQQAGLVKDGELVRARGALAADAAGTSLGAVLGTSTVTSYVESVAGVSAGGRTGMTAVVTGVGMLAALFFQPLIQSVGSGVPVELASGTATCYPVLAPALVLVGAFLLRSIRFIDWSDFRVALPCFLSLTILPLSFSITEGIGWGVIAWSVLSLGRGKGAGWGVHLLSLVFVIRYVFLDA